MIFQNGRRSLFRFYVTCVMLSVVYSDSRGCERCSGLYCGRRTNSNFSDCEEPCTSCPRGYRTDSWFCQKCEEELHLYGWLYLGFVALSVIIAHFYAINFFHSYSPKVWLLYLLVLIEFIVSFMCMILSFEPKYKLKLYTCGVYSIKDWYTIFFNPTTDYGTKLQCTQEAVYPLYTAVHVYLLFSLITMVLCRGILLRLFQKKLGRLAFYAGLYILPIVAVIHTCLAGLLYYVFPYLILLLSAIGIAFYLSLLEFHQQIRMGTTILVITCFLVTHGYGIVTVTEMKEPLRDGLLMILVFLPVSFFALSRPFTHADNFK